MTTHRFVPSFFLLASLATFSLGAPSHGALAQDAPASRPAGTAAAPKDSATKDPAKAQANLKRATDAMVKRFEAKPVAMDMEQSAQVMGMNVKGKGRMMASGDGRMRVEMTQDMPGMGAMKSTVVMDGELFWIHTDAGMMNTVIRGTKKEMDEMMAKQGGMAGMGNDFDLSRQVAQLQKSFTFDEIEEGIEVDGKSAFGVAGSMNSAEKGEGQGPAAAIRGLGVKRCRLVFLNENDLLVGIDMLDGNGKPLSSQRMRNHDFQPKFTDDTFKFVPPEGVQVMNIADLMRQMGSFGTDEDEDMDEDPDETPASKPVGGGR